MINLAQLLFDPFLLLAGEWLPSEPANTLKYTVVRRLFEKVALWPIVVVLVRLSRIAVVTVIAMVIVMVVKVVTVLVNFRRIVR